jgi:hypothetical protein
MSSSGSQTTGSFLRHADGRPSELRDAIAKGDCAQAARLIAAGTDPLLPDSPGRPLLDPERVEPEVLHRIRQEYLRLPSAPDQLEADEGPTIETLRTDGIVKLEGLVDSAELSKLRSEFAQFMRQMALARATKIVTLRKWSHRYDQEHYWHKRQRSYVTNDALRRVPSILSLSGLREIVRVADRF